MKLEDGDRPKLRNVDPIPVVVDGMQAIGLKDPFELADRMVCVRSEFLFALSLLDGRHSLRQIQYELTRQWGQLILMDHIQALLEKLDEAYLLEGERFTQAFHAKLVAYRSSPFRPSSHAGMSYSEDPETLRRELGEYFTSDGGPGMPRFFSDPRRPQGLIAPHIDIRAGGRCFARAYHDLATGQPSDIYVILGTGHQGVKGIFTATNLDFQTPLGTVSTGQGIPG